MNDKVSSYNERLFGGGIGSRLHYARFHWLHQSLDRLNCRPSSVLELGCFDAKTIHFLPVLPERYVGLDANWEGGLDLAKTTWCDARFEFCEQANTRFRPSGCCKVCDREKHM